MTQNSCSDRLWPHSFPSCKFQFGKNWHNSYLQTVSLELSLQSHRYAHTIRANTSLWYQTLVWSIDPRFFRHWVFQWSPGGILCLRVLQIMFDICVTSLDQGAFVTQCEGGFGEVEGCRPWFISWHSNWGMRYWSFFTSQASIIASSFHISFLLLSSPNFVRKLITRICK